MPKDYEEKLLIIKDLMDELMGEMEYGPDEFDMRLGKKKPEAEMKVEIEAVGEEPMDDMEEDDEESKFMQRIAALKK